MSGYCLVKSLILDCKRKEYKPQDLFLDNKKCGSTLFKPLDSSMGSSMGDF
jgi:hypothetical protein